ncbi:hypothetical protein [Serratia marcescens]|uniref:hypothetical protein n=1 Tax=Serratia marcescens TaxID=615 RepID=UPI003F42856B
MITVKRYNPDAAMSISREHAWMRETPEGGHVEYGDYASLFAQFELVKAERDALERQLLISEAKCKGYFSEAATALVKCDALAVENAGFKHALSVILEHVDVTEKGQAGVVAMIANDELFNSETPATSAALAAIQAQGVEKFADFLDSPIDGQHCYQNEVGLARHFASTLREAK